MSASETSQTQHLALFQGIIGLVAILIVWLAWDFVREDGRNRDEAARHQVAVTANLAVSDIRLALSGAVDSLQLLSRLPELRNMHRHGPAAEVSGTINSALLNFVSTLAFFQPSTLVNIVTIWNEFAQSWDFHTASLRRFFYDFGLLSFFEVLPLPDSMEWPFVPPEPASHSPGWADVTAFCAECLEQPLIVTGWFLDSAFGWGAMVPADPLESGRLLAATLNDRDLIRSITVRGLDGKELAAVSEIGAMSMPSGNWWRRGLRLNRPFYAGPAMFDEGLGRPLWQAGVPLRDMMREPEGILTAQIDLEFLSDLAGRAKLTPGSLLIVTDEDGVVIGHPRTSFVVNQVNLRHTHPAVEAALKGEEGESELRISGTSYIAAWRSVRQGAGNRMPRWAMICLTPASELTSGGFRTVLLSVLLASAALGALFYISGLIESAFEEDTEA